jgi:hypothetical protein
VAKNRNGIVGPIKLIWEPERTAFVCPSQKGFEEFNQFSGSNET